jgi:dTDP-4-amino-4,6-dideoxygalactose transaminase
MRVEFYKRHQPENQMDIVRQVIYDENLADEGKAAACLTRLFQRTYGIFHVLWTTSASAALEMAFRLMNLKPGDEVLIPSFTFPSAANAVLLAGGTPIFCDIEGKTQNIDTEKLERWVSPKTRGVVAAHYGGIACDMDALLEWAFLQGFTVVEDSAQGVHAKYKNQWLGTLGDYGAYSFHHTKNFSCGEGGAFLFKDEAMRFGASLLWENGTNKSQFLRKEVSSYAWQCGGSNYVLGSLNRALLVSQLQAANHITEVRKSIFQRYQDQFYLAGLPQRGFQLMEIPEEASPNYHLYYLLCPNHEEREKLRRGLLEDGIDARAHFVPLHLSPMGKKLGYAPEDLPISRTVGDTLLRLPIHTLLTEEQIDYVVERLVKRATRV